MVPISRTGLAIKTISALMAGIFLFNQIAWGGDLINLALEKQYKDQSQTFAPTYLQSQQSSAENLIAQKQDIQDYVAVQNIPAQENVQIDLQGPVCGGMAPSVLQIDTQDQADLFSAYTDITTIDGDNITYKEGRVSCVKRNDGTLISNIEVNENNELKGALISYPDGSTANVADGKMVSRTTSDGTAYYYDEYGLIKSSKMGTVVTSYTYIKDEAGEVFETVLKNADKEIRYGSDHKIKKVSFASGKTVEYKNGAIYRIVESNKSEFMFDIKKGADLKIVSTIAQHTDPDGNTYRYVVGDDLSLSFITGCESASASYDENGDLISITKDGSIITAECVEKIRNEYEKAMAVFQQKQCDTQACKAALDIAGKELENKTLTKEAVSKILNNANSSLSSAQTVVNNKRIAYSAACSAYTSANSAFNVANMALINARSAEALAQRNLATAKSGIAAKQAAYNSAVKNRQLKEELFNAAKANLAKKATGRDQANSDLQKASKALSDTQAAKSSAQAAYSLANKEYISAKSAYDKAINDVDSAKRNENCAKAIADSLYMSYKDMARIFSLFPAQNKEPLDAVAGIGIINVIYDCEGRVLQVNLADGTKQDYVEGLIKSASKGADLVLYGYELDKLNNINEITTDRNGIKSIYDKYGSLESLSGAGVSVSLRDGKIAQIKKFDGTIIENPVCDQNDRVISATIIKTDGTRILYEAGIAREIDKPDGTKLYYGADGNLTRTTSVAGETYDYSQKECADGPRLVVTDSDNGSVVEYAYIKDEGGQVVYTTANDGNVITTYSRDNNVCRTEVLPTQEDPVSTISEYEYGRIRRVYKGDTLAYKYSYEFDDTGSEITVIEDMNTGDVKKYKDEVMMSVTDKDGLVTSYKYDGENRISAATVTYLSKVMNEYEYCYDADNTVIKDKDGVRRTYDKDDKLIFLNDGQKIYAYSYNTGTDGREKTTQTLIRIEDGSGAAANYNNGDLESIARPDGSILSDFVFTDGSVSSHSVANSGDKYFMEYEYSSSGELSRIKIRLEESSYVYSASGVIEEFIDTKDNSLFYDASQRLIKAVSCSGEETDYRYDGADAYYGPFEKEGRWVPCTYYSRYPFYSSSSNFSTKDLDFTGQIGNPSVNMTLAGSFGGTPKSLGYLILNAVFTGAVEFGSLSANINTPENTEIKFMTRSGSTQTPGDSSWTEWAETSKNGGLYKISSPANEYLQIEAVFTSSDLKHFPYISLGSSNPIIYTYSQEKRFDPNSPPADMPFKDYLNFIPERMSLSFVFNDFHNEINGYVLPKDTIVKTESLRDELSRDITLQSSKDDKLTYLVDGKIISIHQRYGDGRIESIAEYSYDDKSNLDNVRLSSARSSLDYETAQARQEISEERMNYLRALAQQKGLAYSQICDQAQSVRDQIAAQRSQLQSQLYQEVTKSRWVGWWIFGWWETYREVVEVPSVRDAINQLNEQERQLNNEESGAYARLSDEVSAAEARLMQDESVAIAKIDEQEDSFRTQILEEEVTPVILDCYRSVLGRDPSDAEADAWFATASYESGVDASMIRTALLNSGERRDQEDFVDRIKERVSGALHGYMALDVAGRNSFLASLGLNAADCVNLSDKDIDGIISSLEEKNIHFGRSAFGSLETLLEEDGITYEIDGLAGKAILIDILTGTLNKFGDSKLLELSMYSLSKTASTFGLDLYNVKLDAGDLKQVFAETGQAIVHLKNDHFVVVTGISPDNRISYLERNRGKDGRIITVSKEDFIKSWTGYCIVKGVLPEIKEKIVSSETAQRIKGSCLPFLLPLIGAIFGAISTATAVVVGAISAVAAGISAVIGPIITGIATLVSGIGQFMAGIGAHLFSAVQFVGGSLINAIGPIGAWLGGMGKAIFGLGGLGGTISATGFDLTRLGIALGKTVVTTALSVGVSKGLEALGINSTISGLLSSFVTGGVSGLFNNSFSASSFIVGGLQGLAIQGVDALGSRFGIDPMLSNVISLTAGSLIGAVGKSISPATGLFDPEVFSVMIEKDVIPDIRSEFVRSSVARTTELLGVDPRLAHAVSSFSSSLINNSMNGIDVITSINRAIDSAVVSVGVSLLEGVDTAFSVLRSPALMSSIEGVLNSEGLFNGVFKILDKLVPSALNAAGKLVDGIFSGAKTFIELVMENGTLDSVNSALNSLFTRETIEDVVAQGGMKEILSKSMNDVVLEDGSAGKELIINNNSSLTFANSGDLISVKENGVSCTGSFVWTSDQGVRLKDGIVEGNLETGYSIWSDIDDGKAVEIKINDINGEQVLEIKSENQGGSIMATQSLSEFNFIITNAILSLASAYVFRINQGKVQSIEQKVNVVSAGTLFNGSKKMLYVLANGITNPEINKDNPPDYILNLMDDLVLHSNGDLTKERDMLPIPFYQGMTPLSSVNGVIDALSWLVESQTIYQGILVQKAWADLRKYFDSNPYEINRPILGMGYSGGFMPLIKAMSLSIYNVKTIVGLGAPSAYINSDIFAIIVSALKLIASNSVESARSILRSNGVGDETFIGELIKLAQDSAGAIFPYLKEALLRLGAMKNYGANTFFYSPPTANLVVNVWGSEDVFYKIGVIDKRESFLGKLTYNIEIAGAEHNDYIRRDISDKVDPPDAWNNTVSNFVADLMIASKNSVKLKDFLGSRSYILKNDNVYVVKLPGCGAL